MNGSTMRAMRARKVVMLMIHPNCREDDHMDLRTFSLFNLYDARINMHAISLRTMARPSLQTTFILVFLLEDTVPS